MCVTLDNKTDLDCMCCLFFCRMMKNMLTTFVLPWKDVAMTAPVLMIATALMKTILEMTCKTLPRNPELPLQLKVDPSGLIAFVFTYVFFCFSSCKRRCIAGCGSESPADFGSDSTYDPQHYPYRGGEENGRKNSAIVEFASDFCWN